MGSAFTPVYPRGASPMPVFQPKGESRPNKRHREHHVTALQHMALDDIDEEQTAAETVPDHVSTSASEASSKASNNSQPPFLEFIGVTCMASAWFTSCFPCAVVDINDSDDYVVDKLSRESAMNVMYANNNDAAATSNSPAVTPNSSSDLGRGQPEGSRENDRNVAHGQLSEQTTRNHSSIHSTPYLINEEYSEDEDVMDTISLDDAGSRRMTPERTDSGITDHREPATPRASETVVENPVQSQPKSPPKKKKKFGMKMFGKKKKS